jgi:hypothetical protein
MASGDQGQEMPVADLFPLVLKLQKFPSLKKSVRLFKGLEWQRETISMGQRYFPFNLAPLRVQKQTLILQGEPAPSLGSSPLNYFSSCLCGHSG